MSDSAGQVYVIRLEGTDYYKVGMTLDVQKRIAGLQTATPFRIELIAVANHKNARIAERDMHEMLKAYQVRNEWFRCDQSDVMNVFKIVNAMMEVDAHLDLPEPILLVNGEPVSAPVSYDDLSPVNQEIENMLKEGYSYRKIERRLGVSHSTIAQVRRLLRSSVLKSPIFNDQLEDEL